MKNWDHVFKALPHINKIWVTKDGNFHLHPYNGGEKIMKEPEIKSLTVKDILDLINAATTKDEVIDIIGEDQRKTIKDAANKKIASFNA